MATFLLRNNCVVKAMSVEEEENMKWWEMFDSYIES